MKSRRQFVMKGTLAATALIASQSFKALASITTPFIHTGNADFSYNNHLVFLHSSELHLSKNNQIIGYLKKVKSTVPNSIMINSGSEQTSNIHFDISANESAELFNNNYNIITKGKVKTGIIFAKFDNEDVINQSEKLAVFLKEEKKCALVVCVSNLGHLQKNSIDDVTLAMQSKNIDVIINGHQSNFKNDTLIIPNNVKNEVIIQSSKGNTDAYGKLEIGLDDKGCKKHIHLATKLYKDIYTA